MDDGGAGGKAWGRRHGIGGLRAGPRRSRTQRDLDLGRVRTQLDRLGDKEAALRLQTGLFDTILSRSTSGLGGLTPAPVLDQIPRDDDFLISMNGEILVHADDVERARPHLPSDDGAWQESPVDFLDNRVVRLTRPGIGKDELRSIIAAMHADHVRATPNYVVPLGYIAKGEGGFEPTEVEPDDDGPGEGAGDGVRVAVVDTGIAEARRGDGWLTNVRRVQATSPEQPGSIDPLYQEPPPAPPPDHPRDHEWHPLDFAAGHGTFVAGIIQQVAPDARISCYHAVQSNGIGSELDIARAILLAAHDGAQIINLSLGTETEEDQPPVGLQVALDLLEERHPDVLVVAAAGNSGRTAPCWPAAFRRVVSVGSVTSEGAGSAWSNHGPWVDCSSIGEGVVSPYVQWCEDREVDKTDPDHFGADAWALGTGTSFAAPQVSGIVAAAMSGQRIASPREALTSILKDAEQVPGYGRLVRVLDGT